MTEWTYRPESLLLVVTSAAAALYLRRSLKDGFFVSQFYLFYYLVFHLLMMVVYLELWTDELQFGMFKYLSENVAKSDISVTVAVAFCLSQFMVIAGMEFWKSTHPRSQRSHRLTIRQWQSLPIGYRPGEVSVLITACHAAILVIVVYTLAQFAFSASPPVWINYYLSDIAEQDKVAIRRVAALDIYPYHLALNTVLPLLSFWAYAVSRAHRSPQLRMAARYLVASVLLAKLGQFNKTGPVIYLLQMLLVFFACRAPVFQLGRKHLLVLAVLVVLVIGIAFGVNTFESGIIGLLSVFERVFMIPNETVFEYFAAIPAQIPFKLGTGMVSVLTPLFAKTELELLPTFMQVGAAVRGTVGNVSNAIFISDAWAEFWWPGIIALSLLAGWLLKWYDAQTLRFGKSGAGIALAISGYGAAFTLTGSSLMTTLVTGGILVNVLFVRWVQSLCKAQPRSAGLLKA